MSELLLIDAGRFLARIALSPNASATEEFAAEELRRHLQEMAGLKSCYYGVAVNRSVGDGPTIYLHDAAQAAAAGIDVVALGLGPEAYRLETRHGNLYILGGGPRGALYGVYGLLERLGWRWYTPTVRHVPACKSVVVPPLAVTESPAFEFRDMWVWDCQDPAWWVRNRLNGWYTRVPEFMGGHHDYCGFVHTFYALLPPDEYFATHPEYYNLEEGKRRHEGGQICLSNPDVLKIVTARVLALMHDNPKLTIFSVSQNDCDGYCTCPDCMRIAEEEGSQSGPVIRFVNAIAAETCKQFPDKLIDTLAYRYSLDAPHQVVPHANVRVRVCSIGCCQGHPYGTCDHAESVRFLRALEQWGRRTDQIYIWHYATNFSHYLTPMPDFDELHGNIQLYRRSGVCGLFMQGMGEEGGGAESMALRGYVISKLLWNPDQDVWALVDEFLSAVYGKAAPHVRDYLDILHEVVRKTPTLHPSLYDPPGAPLFDPAIMGPAEAALAKGEKVARGAARQEIRLLRSGIAYARLGRVAGAHRLVGDRYRGEAELEDAAEFAQLVKLWRKAGVRRLREGEPFASGVRRMERSLGSHAVQRLTVGSQSLTVIPALSGRIHEWTAGGRQWLAEPDPTGVTSDGYTEFYQPPVGGLVEAGERFRVRQGAASLTLTAAAPELGPGLWLSRRYELKDESLVLRSHVENRDERTRRYAWGAGLHLVCPGPAAVVYRDAAGEKRIDWNTLADGLAAGRVLTGANLPLAAFHIEMDGWRITAAFSANITTVIIGKTAARSMLAIDFRSDIADLAPGQKWTFEHVWKCERNV